MTPLPCAWCGKQPISGHHLESDGMTFCSAGHERLKAASLAAPKAEVVGALVGLTMAASRLLALRSGFPAFALTDSAVAELIDEALDHLAEQAAAAERALKP